MGALLGHTANPHQRLLGEEEDNVEREAQVGVDVRREVEGEEKGVDEDE